MSETRRSVLAGVLVTFLAVGLAGCTTPSGGPQELKVGTILPMTGSLEKFGPIMREAAEKAREQVNAAGGAAGMPLRLIHEDSQTSPAPGATAAQKLRTDGVAAIVGAAASGVSKAVLEVTGPNRLIQVSPASTSPEFTTLMEGREANARFFFRTSPSDALQGKVAGAYAIAKGWERVVVLYDNNPYGNGLKATFTQAFEGARVGGSGASARVVSAYAFEEKQASYESVLQQALATCTRAGAVGCPSGIFFAGYPTEATQMVKDWWSRTEWRQVPWLFSEGVQEQSFFDGLRTAGVAAVSGFEGTAPVGVGPGYEAYRALLGKEPPLFSAHTFDAVMLVALATQKAGSSAAAAVRDAMRTVASPPGEQVGPRDFARAVELMRQGQDIDYEGAAGSQNFDAFGDVSSSYEVYMIGGDGKLARKCLVPEANVLQTPVPLPDSCTDRAPPPSSPPPTLPPPIQPPGNATPPNQTEGDLNISFPESGGTGSRPWSAEPREATVAAGRAFGIAFSNPAANQAPHNLTLIRGTSGARIAGHDPPLAPGQSVAIPVGALEAGAYTYFCAIPGHRQLGMEGTLTVA